MEHQIARCLLFHCYTMIGKCSNRPEYVDHVSSLYHTIILFSCGLGTFQSPAMQPIFCFCCFQHPIFLYGRDKKLFSTLITSIWSMRQMVNRTNRCSGSGTYRAASNALSKRLPNIAHKSTPRMLYDVEIQPVSATVFRKHNQLQFCC